MAQEAEQTNIEAIPNGLQWISGIGHVMFRINKTGNRFIVKGMTVHGGKGAWARYNRMFKGRIFKISLNADGEGVHYAEGIRWDDSIRNWVDVPKPDPCLWMRQISRDTYETASLDVCFWNTTLYVWDEHSIVFPKQLYLSILRNSPLRCWECYSGNKECACHSVPQILQILERLGSVTYRIELSNMCGKCLVWHTTPRCLVCSGYYTSSLVGIEECCPICRGQYPPLIGDSYSDRDNDSDSDDSSDDSSGDCGDDSDCDIMGDSPNKDFNHGNGCLFRRLGVCTAGCNQR